MISNFQEQKKNKKPASSPTPKIKSHRLSDRVKSYHTSIF